MADSDESLNSDVDDKRTKGTTRTRRVRAAHRGAVTRLANQLDEALCSNDASRLKQLKRSLQNKIKTLLTLDEQILQSVDEDQVEDEVEQADIVQERAELAIFGIDEALADLDRKLDFKKRSPYIRGSSLERSPSSGSDRDGASLLRPRQPMGNNEPEPDPPSYHHQAVTVTTATPSPMVWTHSLGESLPTVTLPVASCNPQANDLTHAPTQTQGEPASSVFSTDRKSVYVANSALSLNPYESSKVSTSYNANHPCTHTRVSDRTDFTEHSRAMLPVIPEIAVHRSPPPLLPVTALDGEQLPLHLGVTSSQVPLPGMTTHSIPPPDREVGVIGTRMPPLARIQFLDAATADPIVPTHTEQTAGANMSNSLGTATPNMTTDTRMWLAGTAAPRSTNLTALSPVELVTGASKPNIPDMRMQVCPHSESEPFSTHAPLVAATSTEPLKMTFAPIPSILTAPSVTNPAPTLTMPAGTALTSTTPISTALGLPSNFAPLAHPGPNPIFTPIAHAGTYTPVRPDVPHLPAHVAAPQVKLPKLIIKKFNGDMTKWVTFWDSFSSSIHNNTALSGIDKFNYLNSLLESTAAEAIAGLTPTDANYEEAVTTLKRRFGNPQLIINRHMEALLNVSSVSSQEDIKGLRKLHDCVEAHMRGLKALKVPAQSYGGLLTSVLVNKLPSELRLIVTREMTGETWDLERLMKTFEREVDARERAFVPNSSRRTQHRLPTASTLVANTSGSNGKPTCVYCDKGHTSSSCMTVTDAAKRKEVLRKTGRCFVCLKRHHLSRDCRSTFNCRKCRGRHHVSICMRSASRPDKPPTTDGEHTRFEGSKNNEAPQTTSSLCTGAPNQILLQTARLELVNPKSTGTEAVARAVFDSGSQRTYVSSQLRDRLKLPTVRTERIQIKTFGDPEGRDKTYDVVQLGIRVKNDGALKIDALVVPLVCSPLTSQPIDASRDSHEHLAGLELADSALSSDVLEVGVLIGSDWYWSLVTGKVIKGKTGPIAIHTKVGWILSGPTSNLVTVNLTFSSAHALKVDTFSVEPSLDDQLKQFWELEALGIHKDESTVYEKFLQQIRFDGLRYEVSLPWKEHHPPLLDHYDLCRKRLEGLLRRLRQTPQLLKEYDNIIRDQLHKGIIERVAHSNVVGDQIHYLPHHGVVRQDKLTSKLRVVYDASARSSGPSLNDCLYTGPKFGQSIFDILLRFRQYRVALVGDIERAFLMVSVQERDRDSLRFLWTDDPNSEKLEPTAFRFTRVVFGVTASPFLLNATINHHLETFREADPAFVENFLSSIYVDDLVSGSHDVQSARELYLKSKFRLATAGFKLRKFLTNSAELRSIIAEEEKTPADEGSGDNAEEDQSYAKATLGVTTVGGPETTKVLGLCWNIPLDVLQFDIGDVTQTMDGLEPTKRNLVSVTAKFFDPLGVVSPVTILFKMFCQHLCEAKVGWDDPLSGQFLERWNQLRSMLRGAKAVNIPRCIHHIAFPKTARLVGFCDASAKAYAAIVYLRLESEASVDVKFLAAKTRVAPLVSTTIPRLELLSALLLAKLLNSIQGALRPQLSLSDPACFTDSKVSLYWIRGVHHEWRQFVENRVTTIRSLVSPDYWRHCPGAENPADIPSRGMSASALSASSTWLNGPEWLQYKTGTKDTEDLLLADIPEDCQKEMKCKDLLSSVVSVSAVERPTLGVNQVIPPEKYSSSYHLYRVTALVIRFVQKLHANAPQTPSTVHPEADEIRQAKLMWMRDMQAALPSCKSFPDWRRKLDLFKDEDGVWRCGGRMLNSCLASGARNPILLDRDHHLTTLLILEAHKRVLHNGVRETLAELRSSYWVVRGRQIVKKLLRDCVTCRRYEGAPCMGISPPPLPDHRVRMSRPFQTTGVDFAGPMYVKTSDTSGTDKTWMILYTCCATRAVHLDLVQGMSAETFLRSFRRFSARRGMPARMISDNAKTFKSASTSVTHFLANPELKRFFGDVSIEWQFNLEKAPWQGGIFERMIQSAKRCLRKAIGKSCLTFDELLTLVIEVEGVLNSRPLTYVYADDVTEPLTPSHLLVGYRILSLPEVPVSKDASDDYHPKKLTRRADHLVKTLERFWRRWKREYLLELREFHRTHQQGGATSTLQLGEIVTVYDESHPRGMWRLGRVEELLPGSDGRVRGVRVRVMSKGGQPRTIRRPIQHIHPLEVRSPPEPENTITEQSDATRPHSTRKAALCARDRIVGVMMDD